MQHNYNLDIIHLNYNFPLLAKILRQICFWIASYSLLWFIAHQIMILSFSAMITEFVIDKQLDLGFLPLRFAVLIGVFFGITLGCVDHLQSKIYNRNHTLGINILVGSVMYFIVVTTLIIAIRFFAEYFYEHFIGNKSLSGLILEAYDQHINYIILVYTFFMTLVISFLNQMINKFGPGNLLPIILGSFRFPQEQERIFMFLDLNSSTRLAEKLGHVKYSSLIQNSFMDIDKIIRKYDAEIYQYVGDEVVVSWRVNKNQDCFPISFFFAVQDQFTSRENFYQEHFGILPSFKAGVHKGLVTAVEVGDVKREIAYHGDTLNIASRLQNLCKSYNKSILISDTVNQLDNQNFSYNTTSLGLNKLEGRESPIEVFSVEL